MSDLIDRQAAIDAVRATLLSWSYMPEWRDNKIIEAVEQLPPIQPVITHEQAIDYLQSTGWMQEHDLQMMLDGVHRLAAQPEQCEDAVSRQEVADILENADPDLYVDLFNKLPSVTPKQRTGKWIKLDMHRGMADHKCTACEQECYVPTCMGEPMYAFCPNCGAKMEE